MRKVFLMGLWLVAVSLCVGGLRVAGAQVDHVPPAVLPDAPIPVTPLTLKDRFGLEAHTTFGPAALLIPAVSASITMADPPDHYPREWRDGGGAFGRNYGALLARHTTGGLTHFAVAAVDHEDPRYYSSLSKNYGVRAWHALLFTAVDRNMSGHKTLAVSNLTGSVAAGFVGNAFYPSGFSDGTHAGQRTIWEFSTFASHNLTSEFSPEIGKILHKARVPDFVVRAFLPNDRK